MARNVAHPSPLRTPAAPPCALSWPVWTAATRDDFLSANQPTAECAARLTTPNAVPQAIPAPLAGDNVAREPHNQQQLQPKVSQQGQDARPGGATPQTQRQPQTQLQQPHATAPRSGPGGHQAVASCSQRWLASSGKDAAVDGGQVAEVAEAAEVEACGSEGRTEESAGRSPRGAHSGTVAACAGGDVRCTGAMRVTMAGERIACLSLAVPLPSVAGGVLGRRSW